MFSRSVNASPYTQIVTYEYDLYDVATGTPLGAWRVDNNVNLQDVHECLVQARLGQSTLTVAAYFITSEIVDPVYLANGDPHTMTTAPRFSAYPGRLDGLQTTLASDFTFALDLQPAGFLARATFGTTNFVVSPLPMAPLSLAMVEGHDVLGYSEHGSAGWGQLYTFDGSGTLSLLRANPSAHVAAPASDGTRLYWTETYGSTDLTAPQTQTELWSAPYTADPNQLAATASRFAVIPSTTLPLSAVAFGGLVALQTRSSVYVARLSDGKVIQPSPGQGRSFSAMVAVTASELWSMETDASGYYDAYLTRISLGSW
jgi:hypothetical protein